MAAPVLALSEIPTLSSLYRNARLDGRTTEWTPVQSINNVVSLIRYDITCLQVQCIVNAANTSLMGGGGVDGAIHAAAGRDLTRECATLNGCEVGEAKITAGYNLPCEKVVHTVGPMYQREFDKDPERPEILLRSCYRRSLELAVENDIRSIAFPAISTGVYGYPSRGAAVAASDEVRRFLEQPENKDKLDRVIFCNFDRKDEIAYEIVLPFIFPPTEADLAFEEKSASDTNMESEDGSALKEDQVTKDDTTRQDDATRRDDATRMEDESPKNTMSPKNEPASMDDLASKEDPVSKPESVSMEDEAPRDKISSKNESAATDNLASKENLDSKQEAISMEDVVLADEPAPNETLATKDTLKRKLDLMRGDPPEDNVCHKDKSASDESEDSKVTAS